MFYKSSIAWLIIGMTAFTGYVSSQTPVSPVEISYSLVASEVSRFEPVVVLFSIRNRSSQTVKADLGTQGVQHFAFTVVRPDGTKSHMTPPVTEGFRPMGTVEVLAGQTFVKEVLLGDWFSFDLPGRYEVTVLLNGPIFAGEQSPIVDSGAHLTVTVGTRNEQRLQKVCASLADKILAGGKYEETEAAARELSSVNDPVAVPYLKRVVGIRPLAPIVIAGLGRIRNISSVETLISLLSSPDTDTIMLARTSLTRIQDQTTDSALKQRIREGVLTVPSNNHVRSNQ